jgi:UDP-3-O-acyl N-acetylglucosamine deacetylase
MFLQKTIRKTVEVEGVGIHSGEKTTLKFKPAPANTGVYFIRADLPNKPFLKVSATNVQAVSYQTTLGGPHFQVATIEHCVSALSALRIDNIYIELDGPEIPICDGSALYFLKALLQAELIELDEPRRYCYITEPISFVEGDKSAYVLPYHGLRLTVTIDFPHPVIGQQTLDIEINEQTFEREIASARTFGFLKDVEAMKAAGIEAIIAAREEGGKFKDLFDFCKRVDKKQINRRTIESLIRAGAADRSRSAWTWSSRIRRRCAMGDTPSSSRKVACSARTLMQPTRASSSGVSGWSACVPIHDHTRRWSWNRPSAR